MTTAQRLAAPGITVPGADGDPRTIRFDLRALATIEERLGSVHAAVEALIRIHESRGVAFASPLMADLEALLDASVSPRTSDDVLAEVAAPVPELIEALQEAWLQAWPQASPDEGKADAPAAKRGRGRSSTGGRRSASGAATPNSGE